MDRGLEFTDRIIPFSRAESIASEIISRARESSSLFCFFLCLFVFVIPFAASFESMMLPFCRSPHLFASNHVIGHLK